MCHVAAISMVGIRTGPVSLLLIHLLAALRCSCVRVVILGARRSEQQQLQLDTTPGRAGVLRGLSMLVCGVSCSLDVSDGEFVSHIASTSPCVMLLSTDAATARATWCLPHSYVWMHHKIGAFVNCLARRALLRSMFSSRGAAARPAPCFFSP